MSLYPLQLLHWMNSPVTGLLTPRPCVILPFTTTLRSVEFQFRYYRKRHTRFYLLSRPCKILTFSSVKRGHKMALLWVRTTRLFMQYEPFRSRYFFTWQSRLNFTVDILNSIYTYVKEVCKTPWNIPFLGWFDFILKEYLFFVFQKIFVKYIIWIYCLFFKSLPVGVIFGQMLKPLPLYWKKLILTEYVTNDVSVNVQSYLNTHVLFSQRYVFIY